MPAVQLKGKSKKAAPPQRKAPRTKSRSRWATIQGIATLLAGCCALIFVEFMICVLTFNENRPSFGLSRENATMIAIGYGPPLAIIFAGLRDAIHALVVQFDDSEVRWFYFSTSYATAWNYALAVSGALAPMVSILLISAHATNVSAEWIVGISAGVWSITAGDVFNKYLRRFSAAAVVQPDADDVDAPKVTKKSE